MRESKTSVWTCANNFFLNKPVINYSPSHLTHFLLSNCPVAWVYSVWKLKLPQGNIFSKQLFVQSDKAAEHGCHRVLTVLLWASLVNRYVWLDSISNRQERFHPSHPDSRANYALLDSWYCNAINLIIARLKGLYDIYHIPHILPHIHCLLYDCLNHSTLEYFILMWWLIIYKNSNQIWLARFILMRSSNTLNFL